MPTPCEHRTEPAVSLRLSADRDGARVGVLLEFPPVKRPSQHAGIVDSADTTTGEGMTAGAVVEPRAPGAAELTRLALEVSEARRAGTSTAKLCSTWIKHWIPRSPAM